MEFRADNAILVLDGSVFEAFFGGGTIQYRMHVDYLGIEVKPKRDGDLKIIFGHKVGNNLAPAGNIEIGADRMPEFEAFVAQLKASGTTA